MNNPDRLADLEAPNDAQVRELEGGYGFRSRLAALGFTPGARVRMLQNFGHGPVLVTVRGTRIALGRGEAQQVLVEAGQTNDESR